jgi:murein DD-endopeptidase MepM/ murein hydrolase activator NlpD
MSDTTANSRRGTERQDTGPVIDKRVETRLIDLAGGFLPREDGQELSTGEIERYVAEADAAYAESEASLRPSIAPGEAEGEGPPGETGDNGPQSAKPKNYIQLRGATIVAKSSNDDLEGEDDVDTKTLHFRSGDTLAAAFKPVLNDPEKLKSLTDILGHRIGPKFRPGQEVHYTVPAGGGDSDSPLEPLKVTVYTGGNADITVRQNGAGEYVLNDEPVELARRQDETASDQRSTIYQSTYEASVSEGLQPDFIMRFLRIHTYDVDYKTRVQPGDSFEMFYDTIHEDSGVEKPGELLYAAFTIGGEAHGYYRFRTPDGVTDYYDDKGSNSKKFLMRTPIKAGRLTSGFGWRRHPLLGIKKLHPGVDWGAPTGTAILAAGDGVIEAAGREGGYGNYIRLRHGNGYKTAYAHQSRFAKGIVPGMKVRQGQVIGYVGSTGLSTGPHLHYEVLVSNRKVNPMSIQVPHGRQLRSRLLADFTKERQRIHELMNRPPVKSLVANMGK